MKPLLLSDNQPSTVAAMLGGVISHVVTDWAMRLAQEVDPTDTGCYVVIWRGIKEHGGLRWAPVIGMAVGDVSTENFVKYIALAHEKAARLAAHSEHISSFESWDESDPANPKYPGAVRMDLDDIIISCSGFGWKFDEMVGMGIGYHLRLVTNARLEAIVRRSDNEYAGPALGVPMRGD